MNAVIIENNRSVITDPELLKRIKRIEEGKVGFLDTNIVDLKKSLR